MAHFASPIGYRHAGSAPACGSGTISIIDTDTDKVVGELTGAQKPIAKKVIAEIAVGERPWEVAMC